MKETDFVHAKSVPKTYEPLKYVTMPNDSFENKIYCYAVTTMIRPYTVETEIHLLNKIILYVDSI